MDILNMKNSFSGPWNDFGIFENNARKVFFFLLFPSLERRTQDKLSFQSATRYITLLTIQTFIPSWMKNKYKRNIYFSNISSRDSIVFSDLRVKPVYKIYSVGPLYLFGCYYLDHPFLSSTNDRFRTSFVFSWLFLKYLFW